MIPLNRERERERARERETMVPFSPVQLPERLRKAPIEVRWARSRAHERERGPPRNNASCNATRSIVE